MKSAGEGAPWWVVLLAEYWTWVLFLVFAAGFGVADLIKRARRHR